MTSSKQLWLLTGGNGAGKSTFYRLFLAPRGIKLVNADLIAGEINRARPEEFSYEAAEIAGRLMKDLLYKNVSFCYETVFSHESKIDFVAEARGQGYEIILVYIHLDTAELNEARVHQRVTEGGHAVPAEKIKSRIPRTMKNIARTIPLANQVSLFDNSSANNPFKEVARVRRGKCVKVSRPLPIWAGELLRGIL
jgi:predicted ABC-type ATPase